MCDYVGLNLDRYFLPSFIFLLAGDFGLNDSILFKFPVAGVAQGSTGIAPSSDTLLTFSVRKLVGRKDPAFRPLRRSGHLGHLNWPKACCPWGACFFTRQLNELKS